MSPKTASKSSTHFDTETDTASQVRETEDLMHISQEPMSTQTATEISDGAALICVPSDNSAKPGLPVEHQQNSSGIAGAAQEQGACSTAIEPIETADGGLDRNLADDSDSGMGRAASTQVAPTIDGEEEPTDALGQAGSTVTFESPVAAAQRDSSNTADPSLPDPAGISARLHNLVVTVGQVEELSRRAREAAATDLELYNGIATSQGQFENGLAEARRIGREAEDVYRRAFGREAKAVAEPAVAEAREVVQAFAELADAWRQRAESFLAEPRM